MLSSRRYTALLDSMNKIMEKIDENGKATQAQICEIKEGISLLEERVTKLEQKPSRCNTVRVPLIEKAEVKKIVHEVMQEQGVVLRQTNNTAVLDKAKVYEYFECHGYTKHQTLKSLSKASILITDNDGHSCRVVWDGINRKPFRAIVIRLEA